MAIHRNAPAAAEPGRPRRAAPGIAKGNLGTGGDVLGVGRPLKTEIARVHAANYGVYGARKVCGWRLTARGLRWRAAPSSG